MIEIGIEILLDQIGQDIDVRFQLLHARVIALGLGDLGDALAQVLAEVDRAGDRLAALAVLRAVQQLLRERLCLIDLLQGKRLTVAAVDDVIVHFEIHILLEILVELGGADDIGGDNGILAVVQQQDRQRRDKDRADEQQHAPQKLSQLLGKRNMRFMALHCSLPPRRGSCLACSPASF